MFWSKLVEFGNSVLRAGVFMLGCFLLIAAWEWWAGRSLKHYASRHFVVDLCYRLAFIVYVGMMWNPMVDVIATGIPGLKRSVLNAAPLWISLPVYWLVFDFLSYWIHRAQHSRLWWRFHRVHHSQERMTFASAFRNHPIDQLFALSVTAVPGMLLGAPAVSWLPYSFLLAFVDATHHANLPWRFGPLRKVFVSPVFHAQHHSPDRAVHDRNFGGLFSFWDFLFGTAYDAERLPERTGVAGWQVRESFWAHLWSPFQRDAIAVEHRERRAGE